MEYAELNEVLKNINASVVVYRVDENNEVFMEYFNDRFAEIYGGNKEILQSELKKDFTFGVAEKYKQSVLAMFHQAVKTGQKSEATYQAATKTNQEIWVNIKATPVKREHDTIVYVTFFDITNQIKAANEARRNEQYLQSACEFANIFTWVLDLKTKIIRTGKLLQEQIGLPEYMPDFPNCIFTLNMVNPEFEELYREKIASLEAGETKVEFEVKADLPDGLSHWIAYRFDIAEYQDGVPSIAVGTAQFVDVNKRLEARYEHEQKRKVVEDPNMFGYVVSNINANQVIERKIFRDQMQFSDNEYCYEVVADAFAKTIISKAERKKWEKIHSIDNMLTLVSEGTSAVEMELNIVCKDGIMRWVREVMNLVQHPETGEILLYNYFYNIHDQKVFGELMNAMANYGYELCGSLVADLDQLSLVYAGSKNHQLIVGNYTQLNNKFAGIVYKEDVAMYLEKSSIEYIKNITKDGKTGYEITYRTVENGEIRYKKAQCYLYDREEQTYLILRSDVTDTIQNEAEKRKQLETALIEAKKANDAKSSFLSRMSHELRTPLNAINGYTTLIEENIKSGQIEPEVLLENIAVTQRATDYLLTIISDILDIQSIEQGKTVLQKSEVDAETYMKNVADMIRKEAEKKEIAFTYERKTQFSQSYLLDAARFQQVLLNILHNAVKFTPKGGKITMTAEAISQDQKETLLKFVITDNGIGMTKDFVDHQLFHKFAQENNEITSPYDGCGTGLFLSKELIQLMGGTIICKSKKGMGTEFTITINAECVKPKRKERRKRESVSYDLGGIHILLCEDNPMNQDMEKRIMERMNCVVEIADDGQIGVDKFTQKAPYYYDVVLMDIRMPNMDGLEAAKRIRAMDREDGKAVPIIAVSANAFDEDIHKSLRAGMDEHIAKPIRPDVMYNTIRKYVKAIGE